MKILLKDLKQREQKVVNDYLETHKHLLKINDGICKLDSEYWTDKNSIDDLQYNFKELVLVLFKKNETTTIELDIN